MSYRCLLLEDDENDAILIWRKLNLSDFAFGDTAANYTEFMERLNANTYDVVLADWNLPNYTGADAIEVVRQIVPELPIIVVSGSASEADALLAIRNGAAEYIPKNLLLLLPAAIERAVRDARDSRKLLRMQRLESIGSLASGITHDLNNLLFHVVLAIGVVEQSTSSESNRKVLRSASATLARATTLLRQVTLFARGEDTGARTQMNLTPLVQDVAAFARATTKTTAIDVQASQNVPPILGNQSQMHQVLLNLVVNARDAVAANEREGRIVISLDQVEVHDFHVSTVPTALDGKFVRISVRDNGTGIAPESLAHIFEYCYTTKPNGTGIGLSTVMSIAQAHGAHVDVNTTLGSGSMFTILFPVYVPKEVVEPLPALIQGNGELVMVVDDEMAILDVVQQILESCNYRAVTAVCGSEALSLYRRDWRNISVVMTDMAMTSIDGPALAVLLREINPKVKIICATGADSDPALTSRMKADVFLSKPFSSQVLLEAITSLCQRNGK